MISEKQGTLEYHLAAIACFDDKFIQDPNLKVELFTNSGLREIVRVCKKVFSTKHTLAMEDIVLELSKEGLENTYISLMDHAYEKSRYDDLLDQLQTSWMIRESYAKLDSVNAEEITFDEYQSQVASLGKDFNLGTASKWSEQKILDELQRKEEKIHFRRMAFYEEVVAPSKKTVNVIAARTGVGKSAYALNIMNDLAEQYKCLYFNLEMTEKEIYQRLMAIQSGVPIRNFTFMKQNEFVRFQDAAKRFDKKMKVRIYSGSKSIEGVRKIIARESRNEHCLVFIDHIGYITNRKINNTRERVQQIMIDLNNISKDFDCTIFALSQLNRNADDSPKLIDLKDSGEVEQTAHSVVLLNDCTKDYSDSTPRYELICAKNRGRTGKREAIFNKNNQQFQNLKGGLVV